MAIRISVPITTDAKEAKADIAELTKELRQSEQISKLADKELRSNADSAEALSNKHGALTEQLRIQTTILQNQHKAFSSATSDMNEKRRNELTPKSWTAKLGGIKGLSSVLNRA